MVPPGKEETAEEYSLYYKGLLDQTETLPATAFVLAAEKLEFEDMFN